MFNKLCNNLPSYIERHFIILLFLIPLLATSQTLIINEVSQGEAGNMEYVEFIVVDSAATYDCTSSEPPCIDIRGWIIDDNSGYHGPAGVAAGACRFSLDMFWSCIPLGTIIVVYNDADPNPEMPADDLLMSDGNCSLIVPISSPLFETNSTTPGALACDYPLTGWTAGGNWTNIVMANGGDCFRIVDLSGCEVFSVCWDDNNQNNMVYFQGGATSGNSATNTVYYFNNGDPTLTSNWSIGCADQPACGQQDQTPGAPNNSLNADYISQFNNGCNPIPPIQVLSNLIQNATCTCVGQASATPSGSIAGYTYEWFDDNFISIGQTDSIATGLCAGSYYVIVTSSIDCSDTASIIINSLGGGISGINAPPNDTIDCLSNIVTPYNLVSSFVNSGGSINGSISLVDTTSFTMISQTSDGNSCPEVISRTYEITDSCGGVFTAVQNIVILDTINPTATNPAPINVECITDVPAADPAVVIDEADNCGTPTVAFVSETSDNNTCNGEELIRTYSVTDSCGNSINVTHTIVIDSYTPTFTLAGTDPSLCGASDGFITVSGLNPNTDYVLEFNGVAPLTITTDGAGEYVIGGLGSGSYTGFTVSDIDCPSCQTIDGQTISLTDPNAPSLEAGVNQEVCSGTAVTLIADNPDGAIITWNNGVTDGTAFTPAVGTMMYTVTANLAGCINTDQVDVTVNPLPIISAGSNLVLCEGTTVTLTATNPDGATISWDNGVTDGTTFTPGIGIVTYTVTGDLTGCISTDQVDVTVNPNPVFTLSYTDPTACGVEDGTVTIEGLEPNETYDYSYNGGAVQTEVSNAAGEIVIGGLIAGNYTNFEITLNGCTTTANTQINLVDPNAPTIDAGMNQTTCEGETITLTADNPDEATIIWDNGVSDGNPFTPAIGTTIYTVTADLLGCISTDQVTVTVIPLPDVNAGNDIYICLGDQVILSGSGAISYAWDNGVTDGQAFTPTETTTYTVIGTSNGCEGTDQLIVVVNESETVASEADILTGCIPLTTTFSNLNLGAGNECEWTLGDGTIINDCSGFSHTYTSAGCFDVTLTVTSSEGCVSTETFANYICVDNYPIADFTTNPSIVTNINPLVEFSNGSIGALYYEWSFGDGAGSNDVNPSHTYPESADETYEIQLVAISQYGCSDTAVSYLEVIEELIFYVPNTFTPNGDNYNETFQPVFSSGFDPFDYNLLIFNRWDEVIFESNNAKIGWDGTYGNNPEIVKDGTYVWKIEFKTKYSDERRVITGHVNVLK